tara:strand:+ start:17881 stop:19590 length:1710 start_codon:yes stop_codon:yes gene_type:complete
MPIVVQHQPPFSRLGELAYKTGQSQYADRRRREEEARLMQERQMAQQQNMQDQRLAVDVWGRQFGQMGALQRMAIGAQQQQQRDQQQQQFNLDRIDVGHQNLIKINEMQNLNVAERDDRLANSYDDRVRLSDELTRARNEENFRRSIEAKEYQRKIDAGQLQRQQIAVLEGRNMQQESSLMNTKGQDLYMETYDQETGIKEGMRTNEINEDQGMEQLQQIRQQREAIVADPRNYHLGALPGEAVPSRQHPGWNATLMQNGDKVHSPNMTSFQGVPEGERLQEWSRVNTTRTEHADGSITEFIPNPTNPGEPTKKEITSPAVRAREAEAARQAGYTVKLKNIKGVIDNLTDELTAVRENMENTPEPGEEGLGLDYLRLRDTERALTTALASSRREQRNILTESLDSRQAGGMDAPQAAEVAEGPLPGEPDAQFRGVMEGMPGVGGGAPVGLEGVDGQIVPPNEANAGPPAGQIGSLVVDPTAPRGSEGNPVQAPTPMDAVRLPVGTWFSTPDGVVEKVTLEHKRRAGLPVGVDAGAAGGAAVGASGAASVASQPSILDSPAATAFRMLSN